jgi:hypothetical protein
VNPITLPVASGVTGYATVTVTTGVTSTSSSTTAPSDRWQKAGIALAALLPVALLGIRKRGAQMRGWFLCLLVVLMGAALLLPTACGTNASGGGTTTSPTPPQGPTTPSGIYTLNITASIPGLQRNVPVTLTIQ